MRRLPLPRALRVLVATAVAAAAFATPAVAGSAGATPAATDWLGTVDAYRATAGLPGVQANNDWVAGAVAHSRYTVRNGVLGHSEDPAKPGYSTAGHEAGMSGNVDRKSVV